MPSWKAPSSAKSTSSRRRAAHCGRQPSRRRPSPAKSRLSRRPTGKARSDDRQRSDHHHSEAVSRPLSFARIASTITILAHGTPQKLLAIDAGLPLGTSRASSLPSQAMRQRAEVFLHFGITYPPGNLPQARQWPRGVRRTERSQHDRPTASRSGEHCANERSAR